jgi:hypothetical protein
MKTTMRWQGSLNPTNKAGTATYIVGTKSFSVSLAEYDDAQAIWQMLEAAREEGRNSSRVAIKSLLLGALESAKIPA